jgi:hypothetical protein
MYKVNTYRDGIFCTLLFLYQSVVDLNKEVLLSGYLYLAKEYSGLLPWFISENGRLYTLLYFFHRAFVHGLIVRVYTRKSAMLRLYMLTDLSIFSLFALLVLGRRLFPLPLMATDFAVSYLIKLWNTPLLLLFFLPAYYLFIHMANKQEGLENSRG